MTKATQYFITYSQAEKAVLFSVGRLSLSLSPFFCCSQCSFFVPFAQSFGHIFFLFSYSITVRADSLTYDVIYALWNEINFNAKTNVRSLFGTHSRISWKGNLLWAWNLFLRYLLCVFSAKTEKKNGKEKKRKRLSVISLIDTDNGKQN